MAHSIIIGVDYGTTFTGVSFVSANKSTLPSMSDIHIIRNWPGPSREMDQMCKTPSRIAYATENTREMRSSTSNAWGFLVTPRMKSYSWTKLRLADEASSSSYDDRNLQSGDDNGGYMKLPPDKAASDVISDYLYEIFKFMLAQLEQTLTAEVVRVTPFEFWFTVPAIWSDNAKDITKKAAQKAGFGSRPGDKFNMIPEPEAAAIATLKSMTQSSEGGQVKPGDGILICDCGGGTVDITTYLIRQVFPTLKFEELIVGGGGRCGATAIDREFLSWMSSTFGAAFDTLSYQNTGPGSRFMKDFELYKRDFGSSDSLDDEYEVRLVMRGVEDSIHYDNSESMVKFSKSNMIAFFQPVVEKVINLLKDQINLANKIEGGSGRTINRVILVGGFAASQYLRGKVGDWCKENGNISLLCPLDPQAAIVKGAALRGLENIEPERRRARRHYGFEISFPFRTGIDSESDSWTCPFTSAKFCRKRVFWAISKGQHIDKDTVVTQEVNAIMNEDLRSQANVGLFASNFEAAPERTTDPGALQVGTIVCNFEGCDLGIFPNKVVDGKTQWKLEFKLTGYLGAREGVLVVKAFAQGREIGATNINYTPS